MITSATMSGPTFVYLIGAPGSGKSTAMRHLRGLIADEWFPQSKPIAHLVGMPLAAELGPSRGHFSGTDGLAMDAIVKAETWIEQQPYLLLLAEGDRLANDRWFNAVKRAGYALRLYCIDLPGGVLAERHEQRSALIGKRQNDIWFSGRITKVATLAERHHATMLDGQAPPAINALRIYQEVLS